MKELFEYGAYCASLIPKSHSDEIVLLSRRIMYITHYYSNEVIDHDERVETLYNLNDVSDEKGFLKDYNKIIEDRNKNVN